MKTVGLFLLLLAVTEGLECAAAALAFRTRPTVYAVFLCNLLTNPAVNLLLWMGVSAWGLGAYWPLLAALEAAAVAVEAAVLRLLCRWTVRRAALVSLLLNALSCGVGLLGNLLR